MGLSQTPIQPRERPAISSRSHHAPPLSPSNVSLNDPDLAKLKAKLQVMSRSDATAEVLRYQREVMEAQDSIRGRIASFSTILAGFGCSNIDPALPHVEGDSQKTHTNSEEEAESKGSGDRSSGHGIL
jgi:hypothetical protein